MKRIFISTFTVLLIAAIVGFCAGLLTGEVRREESCVLCRATRLSGRHYGMAYSTIEDNSVTTWYRVNIDPNHGLDSRHPHSWLQSACTITVRPGFGVMDYTCTWVPTIFLLRPEIELNVLEKMPDKASQVAMVKSLNSDDRKANARRVRLLIEYYYIERPQQGWARWWKKHATDFGMSASG